MILSYNSIVNFRSSSSSLKVFSFITISIYEGLRPRVKHIYNKNFLPVYYLHASKSALS